MNKRPVGILFMMEEDNITVKVNQNSIVEGEPLEDSGGLLENKAALTKKLRYLT